MIQLVAEFVSSRDKVSWALSRLTLKVEYEDIYDRKMPVKQRELNWFARHFIEQDIQKVKEKAWRTIIVNCFMKPIPCFS